MQKSNHLSQINRHMLLVSVGLSLLGLCIGLVAMISITLKQPHQQYQPEVFEAGTASFTVDPQNISSLNAGETVTVSISMSSEGGQTKAIAARIGWDKTKFEAVGNVAQSSHGFNSAPTINDTEGFAASAYYGNGGKLFDVNSGEITLFSVTLKAKQIIGDASFSGSGSVEFVASNCTDDPECDDNNPCTIDSCDAGTCTHTNNPQDGSWTYSAWSACSGACGGGVGTQTRTANCSASCGGTCGTKDATSQSCTNNTPCDNNSCTPNCSCAVNTCVGSTCPDANGCGGSCNGTKDCSQSPTDEGGDPFNKDVIGGEKDEHGCYISAGYSWCETKNRCISSWETCDTGVEPNHQCFWGMSWCGSKDRCIFSFFESCPETIDPTDQNYCVSENTTRCLANIAQKCVNHQWEEQEICVSPEVCVDGQCLQGDPPIGGDKDEHGCLLAAGYTWCEVKQKCLRTWEEACTLDCTPNCACVANTCIGSTCSDGCGGTCNGTKTNGECSNSTNSNMMIKVRLKGVSKPGVSIMAVVDIMRANEKVTPLQTLTIPFESDANGVFVSGAVNNGTFTPGAINFNLGTYSGEIDVRIKGPKHLRSRFDGRQIAAVLDFSNEELIPGDLPWNNNQQDGGADVYDWEQAIAHVSKLGEEKAEDLDIADVNYDGVVDGADISIVRFATTYRPDAN